jgi:hypothetical protein
MNYAVHALMYFYYFMAAVNSIRKKSGKKTIPFTRYVKPIYITLAQISQMVVGVTITVLGSYLLWYEKLSANGDEVDGCWWTPDNHVAALIMYGSYLFLFLEFFVQRYFSSGGSRQSAGKEVAVNGVTNGTTPKRVKFE